MKYKFRPVQTKFHTRVQANCAHCGERHYTKRLKTAYRSNKHGGLEEIRVCTSCMYEEFETGVDGKSYPSTEMVSTCESDSPHKLHLDSDISKDYIKCPECKGFVRVKNAVGAVCPDCIRVYA